MINLQTMLSSIHDDPRFYTQPQIFYEEFCCLRGR
jgi:hypothetical protein